jgi:protein TonB
MKRFLLLLIFVAGIMCTHGQIVIEFSKEKRKSKMIAKVQVKGVFPDGDTTWQSSLEKNINRSEIGKCAKKGKYTLVVNYVVSKDGSISDISCKNDPGYDICEKSVSIIKKSKRWGPGKVNNRQVFKDTIPRQ